MAENIVPKRKLGTTGLEVSVYGLGTVKFGRNQNIKNACSDGFELPSDQKIEELLDCAMSLGINLIDTAPAYGISEERLGKLLGKRRDNFYLITKVGEEFINNQSSYDFSTKHINYSIERSLKRLKTDRLECVLLHCHKDDLKILTETESLETLSWHKEKGNILSYGVSTMSLDGGLYAAKNSDVVMVSYNLNYRNEEPVIIEARKLNKGILIKKGLLQGNLENSSASKAIQFLVANQAISSIIAGTINIKHLKENVACLA